MADSIKESTQTDDGQIYKIYDRYENDRIDRKRQVNIILTTMHKVKGLEFDAASKKMQVNQGKILKFSQKVNDF